MRRNIRYRKKSKSTTKITTSHHHRRTTTATTTTTAVTTKKIRTRHGKIRKRPTTHDSGGSGGGDDVNSSSSATRLSALCQSRAAAGTTTSILAEPCRTSIVIPMSVMMNDSYNVTSHSILNGDNYDLILPIIDTLTELICSKTNIAVRRFPEDIDQCLLYNNNNNNNNETNINNNDGRATTDDNNDDIPVPIIAFYRNKSLFDANDRHSSTRDDDDDDDNGRKSNGHRYGWIQLWWKYDILAIDDHHRRPYDDTTTPIITTRHHQQQQQQHDLTRQLEHSLQRFVDRRLSNGSFLSLLRRRHSHKNSTTTIASYDEIIRAVSPLGGESRIFSHVIYADSRHHHPTGNNGRAITGWILLFVSQFLYGVLIWLGRRKRLSKMVATNNNQKEEQAILLTEDSLMLMLEAGTRYIKIMETTTTTDQSKDDEENHFREWRSSKCLMTLNDFAGQKTTDDDETLSLTIDTETRLTMDT